MSDKPTLSGFRFFSEVSPKTIETIESACKVLNFAPQTVVYRPGEAADTLYCLAEGEVELSLEVHDKSLKADVQHEEAVHRQMVDQVREIVVDTARSRQIFGGNDRLQQPLYGYAKPEWGNHAGIHRSRRLRISAGSRRQFLSR
jgi:hypothetical protein